MEDYGTVRCAGCGKEARRPGPKKAPYAPWVTVSSYELTKHPEGKIYFCNSDCQYKHGRKQR